VITQPLTAKYSASIVLYNTPKPLLQKVYDSVLQSGIPIELFLIDNSPSPCIKSDDFPAARYTFTGKNLGYGAGHNVAIRKILESSSYHFVLNPDISFQPPTLPAILKFMDSDLTIGQVMPQIVYPNGEIQYLCKLIPSPIDLLARKFLPSFLKFALEPRMHRFELRATGYQTIMDVPYLSGCFMALRVAALQKVGLFDERFFMYPEDIDLTRRMAEFYRTTYFPKVQVIHDHARESYRSYRMLWIHVKNIVSYFNKWGWIVDHKRSFINNRTIRCLNSMDDIVIDP
jgi:hypothetical protein